MRRKSSFLRLNASYSMLQGFGDPFSGRLDCHEVFVKRQDRIDILYPNLSFE
jgi:hypothetical protein